MDLHVTIPTAHGGLTLKNPIMPAASTFGNIIEYAKVFDLNKLGALMGNSMYLTDGTPTGNQKFHRAEDGFMSAFGRNAISIRRFVEEILPELPWETTPVILDLKEAGMEQMEEMVAYVADTGKVAGVEINLNCPYAPGVPKYWKDPEQLTEFIHRVRKAAGTMMVGAKAPTGNYNVAQVTKTLHQAGADSFTCYNGQMGCAVDIYTRKFCCGGASGTSATMGYGYRAYGLSLTREATVAAPIPIIGSGGIINARTVIEQIMVGAYAVQVGSANFMRPDFMPRLVDELAELMEELGVHSLDEIRGTATPN